MVCFLCPDVGVAWLMAGNLRSNFAFFTAILFALHSVFFVYSVGNNKGWFGFGRIFLSSR